MARLTKMLLLVTYADDLPPHQFLNRRDHAGLLG
jgi:hypothetical protein